MFLNTIFRITQHPHTYNMMSDTPCQRIVLIKYIKIN